MPSMGPETITILGKFGGKIEILSTHNLPHLKFAAVCRKIATSGPVFFLTHDSIGPVCPTLTPTQTKLQKAWILNDLESYCHQNAGLINPGT